MSRKETHMIRSHRSRSGYKPTNKTILNKEAKRRRHVNKYLMGMMSRMTINVVHLARIGARGHYYDVKKGDK